jgi:maleylacetate reductase
MGRIAQALGVEDAAQGAYDLAAASGAPLALKDIGMKGADIDVVLELALTNPYRNPRPLERAPLRPLLEAAFEGRRPA